MFENITSAIMSLMHMLTAFAALNHITDWKRSLWFDEVALKYRVRLASQLFTARSPLMSELSSHRRAQRV